VSAFCAACGAAQEPASRFCRACGAPQEDVPSGDPNLGRRLGSYRIESVIAAGGMGVVYRAHDLRLDRRVALKLLREDLASDEEFRRRFITESRSAAALDHPNILPVFDAGEIDGVLYIASRLVAGLDLRGLLAREGVLGVEAALGLAAQVAAALDAAHEHGLVHRDVKPANVLVVRDQADRTDHAYLIDFGVTKRRGVEERHTAAGQFVGTPEYVAPEQVSEAPVDGRADVYALACVLYECLVGEPPFPRATTVDVLHAHLHESPPRASRARTGLPPALDEALLRGMAKNPNRRPQTARALIAAARAAADGGAAVPRAPREAPTAVHPGAPAPFAAPAPARRSRLALIGVATAVIVAAGAAAGAVVALSGASDPNASRRAATSTAPVTTTAPHDDRLDPVAQAAPAPAAPATTQTAPATATQPTATPAAPATGDAAPVATVLTPFAAKGYDIELPEGWDPVLQDRAQPSPAGITRRRIEQRSPAGDVRLLVDHLTGFDTPADENRAALDKAYAEKMAGYRLIGMDELDLPATTGYRWQFSHIEKGRRVRKVNILFDLDGESFAVETVGDAVAYDRLSAIAQQVAETVSTT
jgi:serine/threonine-protein kinase